MPINPLVLQRRHSELGRIRLGDKGGKGQPQKLQKFRFTSVSKRYIEDLSVLYGGQVQSWDNHGVPSWEVYSDAQSIPVIAVKGGLSQWMEQWTGGGCTVRCSGEQDVLNDRPCTCADLPRDRWPCKPTTRLSVMLPELDAIGVFRMESHGWTAAAEIPAVAELAQYVGDLVPATLQLVERRSVKDGKTSRFVVPVLDLQIGTARLREIVAAKSGAPLSVTAEPSVRAIEAAPTAAIVSVPVAESVAACQTVDEARQLWASLAERGALDDAVKTALTSRVGELSAARFVTPVAGDPVAGVEQEDPPGWGAGPVQPAGDLDGVWSQIVAHAGRLGWTTSRLESEFQSFAAVPTSDASWEQLADFLRTLTTGEVPAGAS